MNKVYENILTYVNHEYEPGIGAEIRSFMDYQEEEIANFEFSFDQVENKFNLEISMNNFSVVSAKQLFFKLLLLIEYPFATFYDIVSDSNQIKYDVISYNGEYRGFVLSVIFT